MSNLCEYVSGICLAAPLDDLGCIKGLSILQIVRHNLVNAENLDVVPMRPGTGLMSLSLTPLCTAILSLYIYTYMHMFFNSCTALKPD